MLLRLGSWLMLRLLLMYPRLTCLEMLPPTVDWALKHQSIQSIPVMVTGQCVQGNSWVELPSSQVTLSCVNLTTKLSRTWFLLWRSPKPETWVWRTQPQRKQTEIMWRHMTHNQWGWIEMITGSKHPSPDFKDTVVTPQDYIRKWSS